MKKINILLLRRLRWTRRRIWTTVGAVVAAALLWTFWSVWLSRTEIAFVNFQPIALQGIAQANDNPFIRLYSLSEEDIDRLDRYDVVFINGMGLNIDAAGREKIQRLASSGVPVYTTMATNPDNNISNFSADETALIQEYMMHGGRRNYRSMLSFIRHNIDGKIWFTGEALKPQVKPSDYLWFPAAENGGEDDEEEREFTSVTAYERFLKQQGLYIPGAPRIIVSGQITDPTDLVRALVREKKYNVYPVASFTRLTDYAREIRPAAIINLAHGRLGDDMVGFLKQTNTLLFDPLTINDLVENWENDPMGMMGGFLSQSVVMPEIDGAIRTTALFAQRKDRDGLLHAYAVPERLKTFVETVGHYMALRSKGNASKRVAIVYFKGPGQGGLIASGLDVVPSLYNLLRRMKAEGYNLNGLPADEQTFAQQIRTRGSLFNAFAAGDAARFMREGHPQLVSRADYDRWTSRSLRPDRRKAVDEAFGPFPGDHNHLRTADGRLAFPRLQYGNVVLLPQPMAGEGKDEFKIVHGTDKVPPHSYIAPYLWIQYGFRADALIHFGTHGSLEFTPQKQVALSDNDWPDRLVGALPHFYIYTIDNVGEAMTAKRRSYAQIISYLTPPFHESGLRSIYKNLDEAIRKYNSRGADKRSLGMEIKKLAAGLGLITDLGLNGDMKRPCSDDDVARLEAYADELTQEKVTGTPYTLGVPYADADIRTSVMAMTTDPLAYSRYNIDKLTGRAPARLPASEFNARYLNPATATAASLYNGGAVSDALICRMAGVSEAQLQRAREIMAWRNAPKGMLAMMQAAAEKERKKGKDGKPSGMEKMMASMGRKPMDVPEAHNGPVARFMRRQMRRMMATKDPSKMLEVAKKMGASPEALKKMGDAMKKQMKRGGGMPMGMGAAERQPYSDRDIDLALAIDQVETALKNVAASRRLLAESPAAELDAVSTALRGGYTAPSPGGDPIANPNTLPTGRNLFAINAEETPTAEAWEKGVELAKATIDDYRKRHKGAYPNKVSYTLWSGEFIQTGGATIAQVLYMLGVEPVRDRYGRVNDIRLIPADRLGRPRIDVVVQTSGQLRDLAASRLFLVTKAVKMAAEAPAGRYGNRVKEGVDASERYLVDKGVSPKEAREMASYRVFGGVGGNYGSGIQGMVEQGNAWDNEKQVADMYLNNMGGFYGDPDHWQQNVKEAFAAALTRTDVVVQPRQNNTWGALSLDHVYEFMGGLNLAVRNVTGKDPDAVFSDYRNRNNYRMQDSREAIAVEARTKLFNKAYISEALRGGTTATDNLSEMARNAYGWNVMKPKAVDKALWDEMYAVYVEDKYRLGIHEQLGRTNPAAMEELTATMLETARKGYWKASPQQLARVAQVHTSFVAKYGPSGSSFEGANTKLQDFIARQSSPADAKAYAGSMQRMSQTAPQKDGKGMIMKKTSQQSAADTAESSDGSSGATAVIVVAVVLAVFVVLVIVMRRRRGNR